MRVPEGGVICQSQAGRLGVCLSETSAAAVRIYSGRTTAAPAYGVIVGAVVARHRARRQEAGGGVVSFVRRKDTDFFCRRRPAFAAAARRGRFVLPRPRRRR